MVDGPRTAAISQTGPASQLLTPRHVTRLKPVPNGSLRGVRRVAHLTEPAAASSAAPRPYGLQTVETSSAIGADASGGAPNSSRGCGQRAANPINCPESPLERRQTFTAIKARSSADTDANFYVAPTMTVSLRKCNRCRAPRGGRDGAAAGGTDAPGSMTKCSRRALLGDGWLPIKSQNRPLS